MKLTKEQIQRLNEEIKSGNTMITLHNTRYHLIIKVTTEGICIQSMIAEHNDSGVILNLAEVSETIANNSKKIYENGENKEDSQDRCGDN